MTPQNDVAVANVRVILPYHLRTMAKVGGEVMLQMAGPLTLGAALEELERVWPVLRGTFRESQTGQRRAFVRYFACQEDFSHEPLDTQLPKEVREGREPLMIVGAMAGG